MELWIRTSNRERLLKVNDLMYIERNGHHYITNDEYCDEILGSYKTKERALEVLDEIQNILKPIIHYEPITREKIDYTKPYVQTEQIGSKIVIQELSTYVYEMPKE